MAKKNKTTEATATKTVHKSAAQKIAQGLFATNKTLNEVHITSDGTAFYSVSDAKNHARTLKDKTVETVKRTIPTAPVLKQEQPEADAPATEEAQGEETAETTDADNTDPTDNE